MLSGLLGGNREIFFPKLSKDINLENFSSIAERYLAELGYDPHYCATEEEARLKITELLPQKKWPVYFFQSDTTGEKDFEEFFTNKEILDMERFQNLGVIKNEANFSSTMLNHFLDVIYELRTKAVWEKAPIVDLFNQMIPDFNHKETGKYLDGRM